MPSIVFVLEGLRKQLYLQCKKLLLTFVEFKLLLPAMIYLPLVYFQQFKHAYEEKDGLTATKFILFDHTFKVVSNTGYASV